MPARLCHWSLVARYREIIRCSQCTYTSLVHCHFPGRGKCIWNRSIREKNSGFEIVPLLSRPCPAPGALTSWITFMKWKKYRDTRKIRLRGFIDRTTKEQRFLAEIRTSGFSLSRNWWNIALRREILGPWIKLKETFESLKHEINWTRVSWKL